MNNENNRDEGRLRKLLSGIWGLWPNLIDRLPDWMFAPKAELPPEPPDPTAHGLEIELYERLIDQRKDFHGEISKTIRRVFYALVGTCLFCVITLAGSSDIQLLTPDATVKLPILNYDMGFQAFLVVGPVILIALTIYLHIFVGQHRMLVIPSESRQPMLPNFKSWTAKLVVLVIFYWITPITLATFAWKAWPHPFGQTLHYLSIVLAAGLVLMQMRRCPRGWLAWGLPSLVAGFVIFWQLMLLVETDRHLNLFKADLNEKDLRSTNLSNADLREAKLSKANLQSANLTGANLKYANLTRAYLDKANLTNANLTFANLSNANLIFTNLANANLDYAKLNSANLIGANLKYASLDYAKLNSAYLNNVNLTGANLKYANLTRANLDKANLTNANLYSANLSNANLSNANLSNANLTIAILNSANLSNANLSSANLSSANLSGVTIEQRQLARACGNEDTRLPKGLNIKLCLKE